MALTTQQVDNALTVVADSWPELRRCDVFRLLATTWPEMREELVAGIEFHRPDLVDEANDVIREMIAEGTY